MKNKKLGLLSVILLGVNSIIGTGIFLLPSSLYKIAGDWSVLIVIITGLVVSTVALCFAEASGYFSKNGAAYVYAKEAFGQFAGFEVGFLKWIMQCIAWAVMVVAFSDIVSHAFGFDDNVLLKTIIQVAVVLLLTITNLLGVSFTKIANNISTLCKLIPLGIFVIGGIWFINVDNILPTLQTNTETIANTAQNMTPLSFETIGSAIILCFYAFTGFETFGTAAEDMENPRSNLPKAIIAILIIVPILYALIIGVAVGILGTDIANSKVPIADAASIFMGDYGYLLVSVGSIISILGINIAASFHIPRAVLPLSDDKMIPAWFGLKTTKNAVPWVAIIISGAITLPIALSGSFTTLAILSVATRFVQYIPTCISILIFRRRFAGNEDGGFRIPFGPIIPVLGVIVCIWLLSAQPLMKIGIGLLVMLIISPLYFLSQKKRKNLGNSKS